MEIKLSDYILEQSISTASINDIEYERSRAELHVAIAIMEANLKRYNMQVFQEVDADVPKQMPTQQDFLQNSKPAVVTDVGNKYEQQSQDALKSLGADTNTTPTASSYTALPTHRARKASTQYYRSNDTSKSSGTYSTYTVDDYTAYMIMFISVFKFLLDTLAVWDYRIKYQKWKKKKEKEEVQFIEDPPTYYDNKKNEKYSLGTVSSIIWITLNATEKFCAKVESIIDSGGSEALISKFDESLQYFRDVINDMNNGNIPDNEYSTFDRKYFGMWSNFEKLNNECMSHITKIIEKLEKLKRDEMNSGGKAIKSPIAAENMQKITALIKEVESGMNALMKRTIAVMNKYGEHSYIAEKM